MSQTKQNESVELEKEPAEVLDDLTVGVVETGARRTVRTDRLDAEGVLLIERDEETVGMTPSALYESLYVAGYYYLPEYDSPWEVTEALDQLTESIEETDKHE